MPDIIKCAPLDITPHWKINVSFVIQVKQHAPYHSLIGLIYLSGTMSCITHHEAPGLCSITELLKSKLESSMDGKGFISVLEALLTIDPIWLFGQGDDVLLLCERLHVSFATIALRNHTSRNYSTYSATILNQLLTSPSPLN